MPEPTEASVKNRASQNSHPRTGLSACIITLNEEKRLERCLASLDFVDEVIVLDSNSQDATREIAERCGAKVYTHPFQGFASQKNHAITFATQPWVLALDADEVVSHKLREEIITMLERYQAEPVDFPAAFSLPRLSYYCGRWIWHCGWYPEHKIRLFQRGRAQFYGETVHETMRVDGLVKTMRHHLEHYSYNNISEHLQKIDSYSTLIAREKFARKKKASVLLAVGKAGMKFIITYILRLGFLDGRQGLIISVLAGYYNFLKYIKLWELNYNAKKQPPGNNN